jgi:hypothetical protein
MVVVVVGGVKLTWIVTAWWLVEFSSAGSAIVLAVSRAHCSPLDDSNDARADESNAERGSVSGT